jgi:hypothetical protein
MDRSVVVMDNCSIHHDEDIRQIIEDECGMCFADHMLLHGIADSSICRREINLPTTVLA